MLELISLCKSTGATLLIALALGYLVCYFANKEEKALRAVGFTIGIFIIIASILLILGKLAWRINFCSEFTRMKPPYPLQMPAVKPQK